MNKLISDAWGNILSKSGTMADINPFRYRGYYYDTETGFYYLQTRYYDPEIRRFINADNYELIPTLAGTVGQLNMFAYANNNPIMYTDPTGEFGITATILLSVLGGAAFFAGAEFVKQAYNNGAWNWDIESYDWRSIGIEALKGAINGLAIGLGAVSGGMFLGSFAPIGNLTIGQSIGLLYGISSVVSFSGGVLIYSLEEKENGNFLNAIMSGVGYAAKASLSFIFSGMMVASRIWNVGIGAVNNYSFISRALARYVATFVPNFFFDNAFK